MRSQTKIISTNTKPSIQGAQEDRENDKHRRHRWIAREESHIGDFVKGEPGFTTNHHKLENDIASRNMGFTPPPHDKQADASTYTKNLPQAQSEEAYRQNKPYPGLPDTPPPPPARPTLNGPRASVFGIPDITYTSQAKETMDTVDTRVKRTQVIINGLPPDPRRTDEWKEDLAEASTKKP